MILFKIVRFLDFHLVSNSEKLHNWNNNALQYGVTEDLEIHVMGVKDLGFTFRDPFTKNQEQRPAPAEWSSVSVLCYRVPWFLAVILYRWLILSTQIRFEKMDSGSERIWVLKFIFAIYFLFFWEYIFVPLWLKFESELGSS